MYFLLFPSLNSMVSLPGENKKAGIVRKKTVSKLKRLEINSSMKAKIEIF